MKSILLSTLLLFPLLCQADVPNWVIQPKESSLSFTATQNGAPVTGQFKVFNGEIKGDPAKIDTFSVKITVDINSVFDAYHQLSDTLKSAEWFNVKVFPKATFQSNKFVKTGDKTYEAKGTLTIRDKSQPIVLKFSEVENTGSKGQIKGDTLIKRSAFGIGSGEWADTSVVKDEVKVNFTISAIKK